jgi:hypothetical protein
MAIEASAELSHQTSAATPLAASSQGVNAPINYLATMDAKPYSYTYAPPEGTPATNRKTEPHVVTVHNARSLTGQLSLDREGFEVV